MFSEQPQSIKIEPVKARRHLGGVGFSEVGQLGNPSRGVPLEVLPAYLPSSKKTRPPPEAPGDSGRSHKDSRLPSPEYMDWMKNLALFHQMREKAEESRAKDKMDDYKMQIVRSLMQKNKMLEDIEHKLTKIEDGDDPVQQKVLEKIQALEKTVSNRTLMKKELGNSESKLNQMMDFMMYNMSTLQQMVQNVAQMQRAQYQHALETNKVIQSLPQILSNARFQSGADIPNQIDVKKKKGMASQPTLGKLDLKSNNQKRPNDKKPMDISRISSIRGDDKSKPVEGHKPKQKDDKARHKNSGSQVDRSGHFGRQDSANSDDELLDSAGGQGGRPDGKAAAVRAGGGGANLGNKPGKGKAAFDLQVPGDRLNRGRSGATQQTKSGPKLGQAEGASVDRQGTPMKAADDGEEEESQQAGSIKTDSINLNALGSQHNKTMVKDDSAVFSEGGGQHNVSLLNRSKFRRHPSRRRTDQADGKNEVTLLDMLAHEKSNQASPGQSPGHKQAASNNPILESPTKDPQTASFNPVDPGLPRT
jgi:hypothetical protein